MIDTKKMFDLTGKRALVTGGTRGIGHGIVRALSSAGAKLVFIGASDRVEKVASDFRKEGLDVQGIQFDLARLNDIPAVFERAVDLLGGGIDILVNNAGVQHRCDADQFPFEQWQRLLDINLSATFLMCQQAAAYMKKSGGKIINMASMTSFFGSYRIPAYAASKGGIAQLTKALSNEWSQYGINVNAIAPGGFQTEMTRALWENDEVNRQAMERTPAGRWGNEEDIMGTVVYLAAPASDYVCGVIIPVDGGYLVR